MLYLDTAKSKSATLSADEKADVKWSSDVLKSAYVWATVPETRYVEKSAYGTL